jgi:hypothetical protein
VEQIQNAEPGITANSQSINFSQFLQGHKIKYIRTVLNNSSKSNSIYYMMKMSSSMRTMLCFRLYLLIFISIALISNKCNAAAGDEKEGERI